ncbi:MAG: pyridoxal phosphate-dependent aminotransferase [Saprospiraceae bacterium]|uniref:Aminotransferase n=1 Tax=Candidatus Defluviibacterium haderslevense TaxID=2981993 RepID=A0A9D7XEW1_9BACT|nr:pyridoxal phosphate-dependent aminotransferase [Candidatus Defluviibacterium haderslevense]MBL0237947.1 pyridoxal phosphate-dependent aminotransferase [Candidatus Defluviibacterium haderslevense]
MNTFEIADRVAGMNESATLRMAQKARELTAQGFDIINLSLGEPDFDTPQHIKDSAIAAIQAGITKYTPVSGALDLRQSISEKFKRDNSLNYSPTEIIVSNGAKQSFANLCFALLQEGDEVVLLSPYWVSYYEIIKLAGAKPIIVHAGVDQNFKPKAESILKAISPKTRMLVFSSPSNPTGSVFSKSELESYCNVLRSYPNILVVSDEIYEYIIFDEIHTSIGSLEGMNERTATINGFSKGFSMTGWRLGYMGAPKEVVDACVKIQGQFTSGAASFTQKAGLTALTTPLTPTYQMRDEFKARRDLLLTEIKTISNWKVNMPHGAFYILPEVDFYFGKRKQDHIISNAEDLALFLLHEAKVAVVSGDAFGAPQCLRISYSLSKEKIIEAIRRIKQALDQLH